MNLKNNIAAHCLRIPRLAAAGLLLLLLPMVSTAADSTSVGIVVMHGKGAKQIFLAGHSLGAAHALHYATRTAVDGVVAIAPGHRPESKVFMDLLANEIKKARVLASSGKGDEIVSYYGKLTPDPGHKFAEPNSDHMNAPAVATPQVIDWIRSTAAKK